MTEHAAYYVNTGRIKCRCGWKATTEPADDIDTFGEHCAAAEREAWQARVDAVVAAYKADDSPSGELWDALADLAAAGPVEPPQPPCAACGHAASRHPGACMEWCACPAYVDPGGPVEPPPDEEVDG